MWKWLLPISLLCLLGMASGIGMSSSGSSMSSSGSSMSSSGTGMSSSGTGLSSAAGLPMGTGNTPWQQGAIDGLRIGFHMGQMYAMAQQGYNVSGFNAEVDTYNAWIQQNFGNDQSLMMPKMPMPSYSISPSLATKPIHTVDGSTNQSQRVLGDVVAWNKGTVMGMPASAYYTWNGPESIPSGMGYANSPTYGGMGWV